MDRFFRSPLHDLLRRCLILRERFAALPADPDLNDHALRGYQEVETIRRDAERRVGDPTLGAPSLLPNYLQEYKQWRESMRLIEGYSLVFLERFSDGDRRLTRFCQHLAAQARWPMPTPLVAAFSNDYYWTLPAFNLVAAAPTEGHSLLSLPDLCHELGHLLLEQHEAMIVGNFVLDLAKYVASQRILMAGQQRPSPYLQQIDALFPLWKDRWLREFVSDMIATYLTGPAFGWQHVKLCAVLRSSVYYPGLGEAADHPADEARLRGIHAVLLEMGDPGSVDEVERLWSSYVATTREVRPPNYDLCYPQPLIDSLARRTVGACRALGLRPFGESTPIGGVDVQPLLVEAWRRFLSEPADYGAWEKQQVEQLWQFLGFSM